MKQLPYVSYVSSMTGYLTVCIAPVLLGHRQAVKMLRHSEHSHIPLFVRAYHYHESALVGPAVLFDDQYPLSCHYV